MTLGGHEPTAQKVLQCVLCHIQVCDTVHLRASYSLVKVTVELDRCPGPTLTLHGPNQQREGESADGSAAWKQSSPCHCLEPECRYEAGNYDWSKETVALTYPAAHE